MTERKHVAKTLKNVIEHPVMVGVMDKTVDPNILLTQVDGWWGFDFYSRKPGPALVDGVFKGTDLDLACFMSAIADRGAVINIPTYKSMRPKTIKEGQRVISDENRHGPVLNLVSNKDVFSFGVRIKDAQVVTTDTVGEYRTFSLTDPSGDWYAGWRVIQWSPTAKENKFLTESRLWTDNKVIFKNFVHPNRWTSFYGQYYFITKAIIERLTDQAKYYGQEIKRMVAEGVRYPETGEGAPIVWPKSEREPGKSVKFKSLQVEVDIPEYIGEYPKFENTTENLVRITKDRKIWNNTIIPNLRFPARCTELAFLMYGGERMPAWLSGGTKWEEDYKMKGKKILWRRLVFTQPGVGQRAVAIRMRTREKSEIMNMDYQGGI